MPTLLMTRPREASERFVGLLRAEIAALNVRYAPLIGIEMSEERPEVGTGEHYICTSAQGVGAIVHFDLPKRPVWAVGRATAEAARAAGLVAREAGGDAEALIAEIAASGEAAPLVHLRGAHARGDVAARLRAAGLFARDVVAYTQPEQKFAPEIKEIAGAIVAPVFSPRTGSIFAKDWTGAAPLFVAAMSDAVAEAMKPLSPRLMIVADRPEAEAMAQAVLGLWKAALRLEA